MLKLFYKFIKNPVSRSRLDRFRAIRRANWSFNILLILFLLSLISELVCNNKPLIVSYESKLYFPIFKFYSQDSFLKNGIYNKVNYKEFQKSEAFTSDDKNWMLYTFIPYGPNESIKKENLSVDLSVRARFYPVLKAAYLDLRPDGTIRKSRGIDLFSTFTDRELRGKPAYETLALPKEAQLAINKRFNNETTPEFKFIADLNGTPAELSLSAYEQQESPRKKLRLSIQQIEGKADSERRILTFKGAEAKFPEEKEQGIWKDMNSEQQTTLLELVKKRFESIVPKTDITVGKQLYTVVFNRDDIRFPFHPTSTHWLGLDDSGRDVLTLIVYSFRTNMLFGLILVIVSQVVGIILGAIQGYYGGLVDLVGQRLIEIWSSLPFLYVIIFMGSRFGRSFGLLLLVYCVFNWVGISYYIRAEFFRLRKQAFVESAQISGIPTTKILFSHILPNALVPIITFTPFSLVGAVSTLSALDYLGFGLPPLQPSWGALLSQGQNYTSAWWLILFPTLALFVTILLCVFIGEGVRTAFDPKKYARMK